MKVVLAVFLGFGGFFVTIIYEEMFGSARGPMTPMAFVIMGVYLAICEFFVAKRGVEPGENWATMLGMAAPPVLIWFVLIPLIERRDSFMHDGIPGLLAGCLGPLAGAIAAWALPKKAQET